MWDRDKKRRRPCFMRFRWKSMSLKITCCGRLTGLLIWAAFVLIWRTSTATRAALTVDPELLIRMFLVGYCFGIRSERRLCEEVHLNLAYRWFCRLDLADRIPDHSTVSKNRHGRFRERELLRHLFETTVARCIEEGLASGQRRAVECQSDRSGGQQAEFNTEGRVGCVGHRSIRRAPCRPRVSRHARRGRVWRGQQGAAQVHLTFRPRQPMDSCAQRARFL